MTDGLIDGSVINRWTNGWSINEHVMNAVMNKLNEWENVKMKIDGWKNWWINELMNEWRRVCINQWLIDE